MPYIQTQRVELSIPGYWAVVRPLERLEEVQVLAAAVGTDEQEAQRRIVRHYRDLLATLAATVIVAWNLDDADGHVLPVTAEHARLLRDADLFAILEAAGPGFRLQEMLAAARTLAGLPASAPQPDAADFTAPSMPSSGDSVSPTLSSPPVPTPSWNA